jgi:hypothetical protein
MRDAFTTAFTSKNEGDNKKTGSAIGNWFPIFHGAFANPYSM